MTPAEMDRQLEWLLAACLLNIYPFASAQGGMIWHAGMPQAGVGVRHVLARHPYASGSVRDSEMCDLKMCVINEQDADA